MSGAAAAAAAAAAARRRREEEEMTAYTDRELADGWEFKFLRSATGAFRNPAFLQRTLEEESRSGWTLLEKLDNQRIRLKRPASARSAPAGSSPAQGPDPYRTYVGIGPVALGLTIAGSVLAAVALIVAIIVAATH